MSLSEKQKIAIENGILHLIKFDPAKISEQANEIKAAILDNGVKNSYELFQHIFHNPLLIPNIIETSHIATIGQVRKYMLICVDDRLEKVTKKTGKTLQDINWDVRKIFNTVQKFDDHDSILKIEKKDATEPINENSILSKSAPGKSINSAWDNLRKRSATLPIRGDHAQNVERLRQKAKSAPAEPNEASMRH